MKVQLHPGVIRDVFYKGTFYHCGRHIKNSAVNIYGVFGTERRWI
ncbi:Unknown protein sequence [Pseudomonas syringae pv. cilantro]|uniref:Uncharacterized protein n=1 Tax=Pseudomonas syringae pv. cilantro TaxID=81035 RepID=A0A0N0XA57_PSESX|nr:Unknown protein sequence [Pseudomonas syringae pv. cilantro]